MLNRRTLFGLLGGAAVAPFVPVPAPIDAVMSVSETTWVPGYVYFNTDDRVFYYSAPSGWEEFNPDVRLAG